MSFNDQQEQITELNSIMKANLGVSSIHGVGVIAIRPIVKGEKLYADRVSKLYHIPYGSFGKLFPEIRKIIVERWPHVINNEGFISPDCRLLSFMNHSETPNYDPETDTAIKEIEVGEEITENYCIVKDAEKIYTWLNCKNCAIIKEI